MSIQRIEVGTRMSKSVVYVNTVYLAGIVADKAKGKSVSEQTKEILSLFDGLLDRLDETAMRTMVVAYFS